MKEQISKKEAGKKKKKKKIIKGEKENILDRGI